jgi:ABC-type multidrug transport system permease subunit
VTTFFLRREVYYRERAARFYFPEAYSISSVFVELPWLLFFATWFSTIVYWFAGLKPEVDTFLFFLFGAPKG